MAEKISDRIRKGINSSLKEARQIKWVESLEESVKFSVQPKRFLPFFVLDFVVLMIFFTLFSSGSMALALMPYMEGALPVGVLNMIAGGVAVFAAWVLLNIWITGSLVHQSWKPKEFRQSWKASLKRYPSLLMSLIIVSIVSFAASSVPVAGLILSYIVSMMFLFVNQVIMIDGRGFYKSLKSSTLTFTRRPFSVFLCWLFSSLIAMLILAVFSVPMLMLYFYYAAEYGAENALMYMMLYSDKILLYAGSAVLVLGFAVSKAYGVRFLTDIYMHLRKKKFLVL